MGTKMKGLLKGLRYISQIFDDEDEPEIQIGYPTDVKHVAHIGWDGPSVDSPSWMKDYNPPQTSFQSAPLSINGGQPKETPEVQWVSQDSNRKGNGAQKSLPKSSRKQAMADGSMASPGSPTGERSSKPRQSRRNSSSKESSSDGSKSTKQPPLDSSLVGSASESTSRNLPDIPKKSRRKKSKESGGSGGGSSRSSNRSKAMGPSTSASNFSDPLSAENGLLSVPKSELCQTSSLRPLVEGDHI